MTHYRLPDPDLEALLADDTPYGDATTSALGIGDRPARMIFRARGNLVLCGAEEALRMGQLRGLQAVGPTRHSGEALAAGEAILTLEGSAQAIHAVWKTAQTLMEYLSGIATATADIVAAARRGNPATSVACTRKNFPGTKAGAIKAILSGGASPHRLNLSETLLVFAEHRCFLGDELPAETVARLHHQWPERVVVVEVAGEVEALRWLAAGADVLQLEKQPLEVVSRLRAQIPHNTKTRLAATGGIHSANAEDYARAGADLLVTSAPYFAPPRDVAITISPL